MATAVVRSNILPVILVVNHESARLNQLASAIPGDSYCVETATSVSDALERLQRCPLPHLVLMNVAMPGGDGLEGLRNARQLYPDLKVVATGKVDDTRIATQAVASVPLITCPSRSPKRSWSRCFSSMCWRHQPQLK